MTPEDHDVPEGYKAYPGLVAAVIAIPGDAVVMPTLFDDQGEHRRASQALSLVTTQSIQVSMPSLFHKAMVNTEAWTLICETFSDVAVRAFLLGVYLGQVGLAKLPEPK